jgi:hypothetical protein
VTYLASPYADPDPAVRQARFEIVCRIAGALMARGEVVFSPIAHSHSIQMLANPPLPREWNFWQRQDFEFLRHADILAVATLPGWEESTGVTEEITRAKLLGIPVEYMRFHK